MQSGANGITYAQLQQIQQQLGAMTVQQQQHQQQQQMQAMQYVPVASPVQQQQPQQAPGQDMRQLVSSVPGDVLVRFWPNLQQQGLTDVQSLVKADEASVRAAVPPLGPFRHLMTELHREWTCTCGNVNAGVNTECLRCKGKRIASPPQQPAPAAALQQQQHFVPYVQVQGADGSATPSPAASSALSSPMAFSHPFPAQRTPRTESSSASSSTPPTPSNKNQQLAAHDSAAISKLLLDREKARRAQDFRKADQLREQLRAMEIVWDDDMKTWRAPDGRTGKWGTPSAAAAALGATQQGACLRMKGLPYRVKYEDIKSFFLTAGIEILQFSVVLEKNADGRPSGVGHVKVGSQRDQLLAVEKLNHKNMGCFNRYVWVSPSTNEEYNEAAAKWTGLSSSFNGSTSGNLGGSFNGSNANMLDAVSMPRSGSFLKSSTGSLGKSSDVSPSHGPTRMSSMCTAASRSQRLSVSLNGPFLTLDNTLATNATSMPTTPHAHELPAPAAPVQARAATPSQSSDISSGMAFSPCSAAAYAIETDDEEDMDDEDSEAMRISSICDVARLQSILSAVGKKYSSEDEE